MDRGVIVIAVLALGACGRVREDDAIPAAPAPVASPTTITTSVPPPIPSSPGLPPPPPPSCPVPADVAASPRASAEAEYVARNAASTIAAPTDVYDRIVTDLALIRATFVVDPRLTPWGAETQTEIEVKVDDATMAAVQSGTFHDWDCTNEQFRASVVWAQDNFVVLHTVGRLSELFLSEKYAALPHALGAYGGGIVGDGSFICLSKLSGSTYTYIFSLGEGDCPAGCTKRTFWGFQSDGSVATQIGGPWDHAIPPDEAEALSMATCRTSL